MKKIQLEVNPNWDESYMTVTGIILEDGWLLPPSTTRMKVKDMDSVHLEVWHTAVNQFRTLGNGDWLAARVTVTKMEGCTAQWPGEVDSTPIEVTSPDKLVCEVTARKPDGSVKHLQILLDNEAMIAFFDYFTSTEAWITTHLTDQP